MRLTIPSPVLPGRRLDVDVEPGVPAGAVRRRLALLTGDARWARPHALLQVAGRALDDAHPAGAPPLLPGAHLGDDQAPDDATRAARAGEHLAVLTGPDAGRLVPLPDGARERVPLAPDPPDGPGSQAGTRPRSPAPPAHLEVSRRGSRVRFRVVGARGTLHPRARTDGRSRRGARTARAVAAGWSRRRTWPWGAHVQVAATVLVLRRPAGAPQVRARPWQRVPPWAWTAVVSSTAALALAVVLRQPLLLLTAVTGAVGLLGRSGRGTDGQRDGASADPGTTAPVPRDVADLRLATAQRLHDRAGPVPGDDGAWPADRTLALVGSRDATLAAARALVLRSLGAGTPARLVLRGTVGVDWRWTRWWDPSDDLPPPEDRDALVVADGADDVVGAWRAASPYARLVVLVPEGAAAPAWVSTVLRAGGDVARRRDRPPHGHADTPARRPGAAAPTGGRTTGATTAGAVRTDCPETVGEDVADAQARAAAALTWLLARRDGAGTSTLPATVSLGELPGVPPPDAVGVGARWTRAADARTLAAPVGVGPGGRPTVVDLVRDGPHALVAGTTGSGKSELLTTLVLALALTHPPRRLALLLVDFKGGTGLGPLAALPHVVDHVHDLDLAAARRTLQGLHAELHRRERLLAAAGRTDITDLDPADPATPARLLVVVDELRALVDDLPGAAATLARLGAQGRALGMHLVLATQRPAGAVPADLRANIGLRIALRVADEDDSRDVVGTPDAAHLDVGAPGRALVRVGPRPAVPVQVARARARATAAPVRLATAAPGPVATTWRATRAPQDDVAAWVTAARTAATGRARTGVPWLPALPDRVPAATVGTPAGPAGVLVAVADVPDEQRRAAVRWRPDEGPLLVLGGPGSGRSTTLLTVGTHALHAGAYVHAVGLPDVALAHLRAVGPHGVGTTLPLDDVHRALLLLDRLAARRETGGPADVLLVDGLDALLDSLAAHARGIGADLLTTLLRRPPAGVRTAVAGPVVPAVSRLLGAFALRLVLPVPDPSLDLQAGVPPARSGPRSTPGRAVVCASDGAHVCQVVLPDLRPALTDGTRGTVPGAGPVRIGVLPGRSPLTRAVRTGHGTAGCGDGAGPSAAAMLPLGVGGDGPHLVEVERARPLVVAGPSGSGRTTALRTLAQGWAAHGREVLVVTSRPGATRHGGDPSPGDVVELSPDDTAAALDRIAAADPRDDPRARRPVLLVDDLDLVERTAPLLADRLEAALSAPWDGVRLVAVATTSEHAASGYRGPVASALRSRQVLVLDPHGPAAVDLLGPGAALHGDPWHRPPGRGVLRRDRALVRVQVHVPDTVQASACEPCGC